MPQKCFDLRDNKLYILLCELKSRDGNIIQTVKIKGMTCNYFVMAVTKALEGIDGISSIKVDLQKADATFDEVKPADMKAVRDRIRKAGYGIA